ncbi:cytochrome P450 [Phytohabitans kaempferiae]|uniref:Cytochrome P450 n=1 Tax=Phytohabitans kaempferiae TaxID=1620943 RepID=A0ABV6LZC1_9ACTN
MTTEAGLGAPARPDGTVHADDVLAEVLKVDLADPRLYATDRPERIWRTMRGAGLPLRMPGPREHWAVTRYRQVRDVLGQSHLLSSERGMRLGEKASDGQAGEAAGGMSMLVTDDPAHGEMRKALESAFTPRQMRRLAGGTEALARRLVVEAAAQPSVDFVASVATPLLTTVACDLLGVPESDRPHVASLTSTAFSGSGHATASATAQIGAHTQLLEYCAELIASKRRAPGDDVASLLAQARMNGRPMPTHIAVMNCHDFILGGNASARFILTSIPVTLVRHRPFWTELRTGRADFDVATEELLRFEAPVNHLMRTLTGDVEVEGVRMRAGELVTLWLRSANRDADIFDDPDTMRATGRRHAHLTFGHGPHYCIAAYLARLEIRSLIRALAEEVADAELSAPPRRMESNFLRGYRAVPVALRPRA